MTVFWIGIIYYLVVNIVAFCLMYVDKRKAVKGKWRIKERTLFISALIGGFIGYYFGMFKFHHKTSKALFHTCFYVSLFIHVFIFYFLVF